MAGNNDKGKPKSVAVPVEPLDMAATIAFLLKVAPDEPMTEKNVARLVKVYGIKQKAMGGKIKKKMAKGGKTFPDLTGDGKVTQADILKGRGVFAYGGKAKKKMMGGGKVYKKTYAKGGGMRKAQHY